MSKPTTVQQRIFWEYAKLIARSAVGDSAREDWRFTNYTFQRLKRGEIRPSELTRDNKKLVVDPPGEPLSLRALHKIFADR